MFVCSLNSLAVSTWQQIRRSAMMMQSRTMSKAIAISTFLFLSQHFVDVGMNTGRIVIEIEWESFLTKRQSILFAPSAARAACRERIGPRSQCLKRGINHNQKCQ
jgi:hypothetical protein